MVVVSGLGQVPAARVAPRRPGPGGFVVPEGASEPVATTGAVSLPSLLGLQEAQQDAVQDREARRHGETMLDVLRDMQLELLGGDPRGAPEALAALARRMPAAADPRLAGVQQALMLRSAVERARAAAPRSRNES